MRPWGRAAHAAEREIHEELGYRIEKLRQVSTHLATAEGKRDTVFVFEAIAMEEPSPDGIEVVEARSFSFDELPQDDSPAARRRLAERRGERGVDQARQRVEPCN